MPFLAPFVPAIIGAAGSIGGGLLARSAGGKGGSQDPLMGELLSTQKQRSEELYGAGRETMEKGIGLFDDPIAYFSKLLGGDRAAMAEAIAPEARTISEQYDVTKRAVEKFAPPGGGRSTMLGELPYRKAADVTTLLQKVRPEAARQMSGIASVLSNLGLSEAGMGASLTDSALSSLLGQRGQDIAKRSQDISLFSGLGQSIARLIGSLNLGGGTTARSQNTGNWGPAPGLF